MPTADSEKEQPKKRIILNVQRAANGFVLNVNHDMMYGPPSMETQPETYVFRTMQDLIIKMRELLDD